ncbi:MAG: RNA polymerase sigma-70 factor [Bacteroidales bacterium]|nr:RNA polymerase sigma-70 factor [Bacteroides sp.]MCM1501612.1 RNA polymerase sigma-70 factor [Bacteroidales bacterium]
MRLSENTSDIILLDLLSRSSRPAYKLLFSRYYSPLCAYACLFVKDRDTCENIVQELMVWLWENRVSLHISESLSRYLFTATRNRCLKHISHGMVERRVFEDFRKRLNSQFESPDFYIVKELEEKIREAVAALPESYRQAFVLNRFQGRTYNEIAQMLNVSTKTVDYRIQQSLKLLRVSLKDYLPALAAFLALYD